MTVVATYTYDPSTVDERKKIQDEHLEFISRLEEAGKPLAVGKIGRGIRRHPLLVESCGCCGSAEFACCGPVQQCRIHYQDNLARMVSCTRHFGAALNQCSARRRSRRSHLALPFISSIHTPSKSVLKVRLSS